MLTHSLNAFYFLPKYLEKGGGLTGSEEERVKLPVLNSSVGGCVVDMTSWLGRLGSY